MDEMFFTIMSKDLLSSQKINDISNVGGAEVNKEGPDLFGRDGHSESFISTTLKAAVS